MGKTVNCPSIQAEYFAYLPVDKFGWLDFQAGEVGLRRFGSPLHPRHSP